VILSNEGVPLFRIRNNRTAVVLLLPIEMASHRVLSEVRGALQCIMEKHIRRPQKVIRETEGAGISNGDHDGPEFSKVCRNTNPTTDDE
jgi:hypothetical protein